MKRLILYIVAVPALAATLSAGEPPLPLTSATRGVSSPLASSARPIYFDRTIFANVQSPPRPAGKPNAASASASLHRRALVTAKPAAPSAGGASGGTAAPAAASASGKAAQPAPSYGWSNIPMHRRTLGW